MRFIDKISDVVDDWVVDGERIIARELKGFELTSGAGGEIPPSTPLVQNASKPPSENRPDSGSASLSSLLGV